MTTSFDSHGVLELYSESKRYAPTWVNLLMWSYHTSNDWAVKTLKRAWKPLQRWVYAAAVLTLAHWIFLEYELGTALAHFLPLAGLELYRIIRNSRLSAALVDA